MEATFTVVDLIGQSSVGASATTSTDPLSRLRSATVAACGSDDHLVKAVGDSVILVSANPRCALELVGRLLADLAAQPSPPSVRVGIHHGEAVRRGNDWFGSTINIAGRISAHGKRGQIVATEAVARMAGEAGFATRDLGFFELRGVLTPVQLFTLDPPDQDSRHAVDPACGAELDPDDAVGRLHYAGVDYYFCSLECAALFAADPARVLDRL